MILAIFNILFVDFLKPNHYNVLYIGIYNKEESSFLL